jgi:hypothetical protein
MVGLVALAACDGFIEVTNPNVVEAGSIDPDEDSALLAWSAYQDFVAGFGDIIMNVSWFTTDAWSGDSSEDRSEIARRAIDPGNARLLNDIWTRFSRGLATSEDAIDILVNATDAGSNIHLARVSLSAGYSYLLMAETFCRGTVRGGPPLDESQMLDLAVERLSAARQIGSAAGGSDGDAIVMAASVGLGRSHLLAGEASMAVSAVSGVPESFEYLLYNADDPANRERLGNKFWEATADRASLVVPPRYRALADGGDPRVGYVDTGVNAYDGILRMYAQSKYPSWAAPYRLASGLEARYIAIEANGDEGAMLAWVNERRAAGGHDPVSLSGQALFTEFLTQKSIDLWLEGQRMGDFRRHGTSLPDLLPTGSELYKPAAGPVGDDTCFPLPIAETSANPNF